MTVPYKTQLADTEALSNKTVEKQGEEPWNQINTTKDLFTEHSKLNNKWVSLLLLN